MLVEAPCVMACFLRGYTEKKIQENVECEIMMVVAEEARDSYK